MNEVIVVEVTTRRDESDAFDETIGASYTKSDYLEAEANALLEVESPISSDIDTESEP